MPRTPERPRRITLVRNGPLLVEGPVEVVGDDGEVSVSRRFTVAICMCRRSRSYPWCDTSHRHRGTRTSDPADTAECRAMAVRGKEISDDDRRRG
ncbi:CDGSH iron-sulfur domain-containing protein [Streptomyces sioyaensis]|uniref:CDGSH iron-sulfur domain-containing protein n=1 Tax=Streptomyces sioyaensis TaxID=67364 RepID=UPI001F3507FE|nr:CDGSH iron-sulfur domain-containing protein [Streptomyces sioyaensis]MCF3172005.1 CDGSH iron-sulfur domain-containing protein [Streptomyces sioyaensis]